MSGAVALELPDLPEPTRAFVLKDIALRWLTDLIVSSGGATPKLEAVAEYPLPKPASIGAGVFRADLAIRDTLTNKTVALGFLASPGESLNQLQARVEPYKKFVEAAPHVFGAQCRLLVFLPHDTLALDSELRWLDTPPEQRVVFTY